MAVLPDVDADEDDGDAGDEHGAEYRQDVHHSLGLVVRVPVGRQRLLQVRFCIDYSAFFGFRLYVQAS